MYIGIRIAYSNGVDISLCTFVLYLVCTCINVCVSIWKVWTALPIMYARLIQHTLVQFG